MNAVITGASSGIGLATAKLLCEKGWKVYGLSRHQPPLKHKNFTFVDCDVASWESIQAAAAKVAAPVDLLVPNAGIDLRAPLAEMGVEDFDRMMGVNFRGVYLTIKAFLGGMLARKSGTIVVVSSKSGLNPSSKAPAYVASKHAVQGFVKSIRADCAKSNVRVSLVCPGGVDTNIRAKPRPDYLPAEEIAKTILFIAERPDGTVVEQIEIEPIVQAKEGYF